MQVTLKQSEITAAIAAYLTNVLGVSNVSPETLSVVYKQGRSDKNGMTAELDIEAPSYHKADTSKAKTAQAFAIDDDGKVNISKETANTASLTHEVAARSNDHASIGQASVAGSSVGESLGNASASTQTEATSASAAQAPEVAPAEAAQDPEQAGLADPSPVYEGERRAEPREERVAELKEEIEQHLAEDKPETQAEQPAAEEPAKAAEQVTAASPLFG